MPRPALNTALNKLNTESRIRTDDSNAGVVKNDKGSKYAITVGIVWGRTEWQVVEYTVFILSGNSSLPLPVGQLTRPLIRTAK